METVNLSLKGVPRVPLSDFRPARLPLVVVGDLIGEGSAQEQSVVGETPNLAARLQALAEPNTNWQLGRDLAVVEEIV